MIPAGWRTSRTVDFQKASVRRLLAPPQHPAHENPAVAGVKVKRLKGLEPSTFCMASRRSSQLSYSRARRSIDVGGVLDSACPMPRWHLDSLKVPLARGQAFALGRQS
jgi:hypothetical protein